MIEVELANNQTDFSFREQRLVAAVRKVLEEEGIRNASVSIAVVGTAQIHQLNRDYLQHDYPTDVLSFLFGREGDQLEGEIVVCAATAAQVVVGSACSLEDELLLYVIHGALHLVGHDDHTDEERAAMRSRERYFLDHFEARVVHDVNDTLGTSASCGSLPDHHLGEDPPS